MHPTEDPQVTGVRRWSDRVLFLLVLAILFPLYVSTAAYGPPYHIDAKTNVYTAATLARTGSPILLEYEALATPEAFGVLGWVVESPRGPVSQYPPGTALFATPAYLLTGGAAEAVLLRGTNDPDIAAVEVRNPPLWPAAVTASLASSIAAAALAVAVHRLVGTRWAFASALTLGVGTGLWLNGAHMLWQHGVASMWILLGLLAASRGSWLPSGFAFGASVLTRPPVAIISAVFGTWTSWRHRDWRPAVLHGIGALAGLGVLLAYNYWLWQGITVSGGYSAVFSERLLGADDWWYARNVLGGLFSLDRGLLVWSPFVGVALVGLPRVWRELPSWVTGSFLGGVLLLLVQFRLNRFSGGEGFSSYRYPLEPLAAAMPALAVAARGIWERGGTMRRLLLYSVGSSVAIHGIALVDRLVRS